MKNSLIQKYRGLLALTVFIFHCGIVGTNFLWAGVETFFVLSAFVITLICVIIYKIITKKVTELLKNRKERKNDTAI